MGRDDRHARRNAAHDAKTAQYREQQAAGEAPQLTRQELEKLMREHPGVVRFAHPVAGGKFEVHFHRGKRPKGV